MVPTTLKQEVLRECHDLPAVGHVGIRRTMELVDRQFYWCGMRGDVTSYVKTCPTCQQMKSDNRAKAELLQPLPIPTRKWKQVATNLVTDLPEFGGYIAIAVFVDRLTMMVHFAPCTKEVTVPNMRNYLWTMSLGYTVYGECSFWIEIHDLTVGSGKVFSTCLVPRSE